MVCIDHVNDNVFIVLWEYFPDGEFHSTAWFTGDYHISGKQIAYKNYRIIFNTIVETWSTVDLEVIDRQQTNGKYSRGRLR